MKRTAHRQVTVPGPEGKSIVWMMEIDPDGNLNMRKRHARRGVTIRADELAKKAEQLYEGSLALYIDAPKTPAMSVESGGVE